MFRTLAALLALPFAASAVVAQDTRPTVAVLYFDNNSIGKDAADFAGVGKGIADLLITDLASNNTVRVIERDRLQALLQEQNLTRDGAIDAQTAVRIGKLLGVRHLITGGFMSTGRQMVLTARTIEVETGAISNPQRVQRADDDVLGLIGQLSSSVASSLKLPPVERRTGDASQQGHGAHGAHHAVATQAGTQNATTSATGAQPPAAQPAKLDLRTALLYSKALDAQDAGDRTRAVDLYNQVLDRFPTFEPARTSRDRLQSSGN